MPVKKWIKNIRRAKKFSQRETDGTVFSKNLGVKGSHISGGQKQRVAIERTILHNPNILLLD